MSPGVLLVIAWVVGDVHLAVFAGNGTVFFEYYRSVMIQACGAMLEEGSDDNDTQFFSQCTIELRRRAGNGFCLIERLDVLFLTEVQPVVQFLQHHEFSALCRQTPDFLRQTSFVVVAVGRIVLLYDTYLHCPCGLLLHVETKTDAVVVLAQVTNLLCGFIAAHGCQHLQHGQQFLRLKE